MTDPDSLVVSTETNQIKGSMYVADDFDHDGDIEAMVAIPDKKSGDYELEVIPKDYASPTDVYSLKAELGGQTVDIANETQIRNIPVQGYSLPVGIAPSIITDTASSIGFGDACLNGDLTSLGTSASAKISFEWGTASGALNTETVPKNTGNKGAFNYTLGALSPTTTYFFRAKSSRRRPIRVDNRLEKPLRQLFRRTPHTGTNRVLQHQALRKKVGP